MMNLIDLKERIVIATKLVNGERVPMFTPTERNFLLEAINATPEWQVAEGRAVLTTPANYLGRIEHLYAALSLDDGGEGLCAAPMFNRTTVPLIAADKARLSSIISTARSIAHMSGKPVRIAKFTTREDIEILMP